MPAAEEERRDKTTKGEGVQQLTGIEQAEFHTRIFDVETGNDFRFAFIQVERRTSQFGNGRNQENQRAERRNQHKPDAAIGELRFCNGFQAHRTGQHSRDQQGDNHRDFVRNHVCHHAVRAKQGVLIVRGPARHDDGKCANRARRHQVKQGHVQVNAIDARSQRNHGPQEEHRCQRKDRSQIKRNPIRAFRGDIFLQNQFDNIREWLE